MNGVDGLSPPSPVARAPEYLAEPAIGRDGESTNRWRQVGEPSGRERGPASVPAKTGNEEWPGCFFAVDTYWSLLISEFRDASAGNFVFK